MGDSCLPTGRLHFLILSEDKIILFRMTGRFIEDDGKLLEFKKMLNGEKPVRRACLFDRQAQNCYKLK